MKECGSQMTELELRAFWDVFSLVAMMPIRRSECLARRKTRVALAKTIVSKSQFSDVMSQLTIDMHSCDLLIEALNKYEGTLILVSHDRYFISKTANKIWEIVDQK